MSQPSPITPDPIMKVACGFMASRHLFAAAAIDLFAALGDGPITLEELAAKAGVPARTARISADAMVALGFVEKEGGRYHNSTVAQTFLAGKTPADLRPFLKFWDTISYPKWMGLERALRTGEGVERGRRATPEETRIFNEGVAAVTRGSARALAAVVDWSKHQKVLDLGGGTGNFLVALLAAFPGLSGTLVELPEAAALAREHLAGQPTASRVQVVAGDFFDVPLPEGHDAILLANVVHVLSPERNHLLLKRIRDAVAPGARLYAVDFWLEPSKTAPLFAALMAGEFLVLTGEGESYSDEEYRGWLTAGGWKAVDKQELGGPAQVVIAEAV